MVQSVYPDIPHSTNRPQKISRALGCHPSCSHTISDPNCQQRPILQSLAWTKKKRMFSQGMMKSIDPKTACMPECLVYCIYWMHTHTHIRCSPSSDTPDEPRGGSSISLQPRQAFTEDWHDGYQGRGLVNERQWIIYESDRVVKREGDHDEWVDVLLFFHKLVFGSLCIASRLHAQWTVPVVWHSMPSKQPTFNEWGGWGRKKKRHSPKHTEHGFQNPFLMALSFLFSPIL